MAQPGAQRTAEDEDGEGEGDGESGSGDFGRPQLKPNLEALFDPSTVLAESQGGDHAEPTSPPPEGVERFGEWDLRAASLMLYHRQMKKRLMLEQLDAPSKMMKVIVALATQPHAAGQWDIEHLVKALDHATHKKFGKGLYQIASLSSDASKLDWRTGTMAYVEPHRGPAGMP